MHKHKACVTASHSGNVQRSLMHQKKKKKYSEEDFKLANINVNNAQDIFQILYINI